MLNTRPNLGEERKAPRGVLLLSNDGTTAFHQGLTACIATQGADNRFGAILTAVRDHGVVLAMLPPWGRPFELPTGRPVIALAEDLASGTFGPSAFHRASLRSALRTADNIVVQSSQAPEPYLAAAIAAAKGEHVFLVDTGPEQEAQWVETIRALAAGREILLVCEKPQGGAQ